MNCEMGSVSASDCPGSGVFFREAGSNRQFSARLSDQSFRLPFLGKVRTGLSRFITISALAALVSGCSMFGSGDEEPKPAPLPVVKNKYVTGKKLWKRQIGDGASDLWQKLQITLDDDQLFAADSAGRVVAYNRITGKKLWSVKLDVSISGGLTADDGLLFFGTTGGRAFAVDAENGAVKWQSPLSSEVLAPPAVGDDFVVVQTIDDKLVGLSIETGEKKWEQSALQPALTLRGSSTPLSESGMVFASFSSGEVRAYRLKDGGNLWSSRIAVPKGSSELERMVDIVGNALLTRDALFVASIQGNVAAIDPSSGQLMWAKEASSYRGVAQGYGAVYLVDENDVVQAVDQRTGNALWRQESFKRRGLSTPFVWENYVLVGDNEGRIHALSQMDGSLVGRFQVVSSAIAVQPVVDEDIVYVYGLDGQLVAYRLHSAELNSGRENKKSAGLFGLFGSSEENPAEESVEVRNAETASDEAAYDALDESAQDNKDSSEAGTTFDRSSLMDRPQAPNGSGLY